MHGDAGWIADLKDLPLAAQPLTALFGAAIVIIGLSLMIARAIGRSQEADDLSILRDGIEWRAAKNISGFRAKRTFEASLLITAALVLGSPLAFRGLHNAIGLWLSPDYASLGAGSLLGGSIVAIVIIASVRSRRQYRAYESMLRAEAEVDARPFRDRPHFSRD